MSRKRKKRRKAQEKQNDPGQVELLPDMVEETAVADADSQGHGAAEPDVDAGQPEVDEPEVGADGPEVDAAEPEVDADESDVGSDGPKMGSDAPKAGADEPTTDSASPAAAPDTRKKPTPPDTTDEGAPPAPRPAGNQLARARDLVESGRVKEAIALYQSILAERPENLKAHNNLGVLLDELGERTRALEHFEAALAVEPQNVEVLTNYGSTLTGLARYDEAEDALRLAQRLAPDDLRTRLVLGILAFRRGLYELAETELHSVCDRDPEHGLAYYYRGEALNRAGRFDDAIEVMLRAAELLPDDPRPVYTLGHLYDRKNLPGEAAEMYRRAKALQAEAAP